MISKRGALSRVSSPKFTAESIYGTKLLERLETKVAFLDLQNDLIQLKTDKTILDEQKGKLEAEVTQLANEIQNQTNILDEIKRETQTLKDDVDEVSEFFKAGYNRNDLKTLRKDLDLPGIRDNPSLSLDRLVTGLEKFRNLVHLEDTIKESSKELETLQTNLSVTKGELTAIHDVIIQDIEAAKTDATTKFVDYVTNTFQTVNLELKESAETAKSTAENVKNSILDIRKQAEDTGRTIGKLEAIAPIQKLIMVEGDLGEVFLVMNLMCTSFKPWLKKKQIGEYTIMPSLDLLIRDLGELPK